MSKIEWTEQTFNPMPGCSKVSPGCKNCYALRMSRRLQGIGHRHYQGLVENGNWTGRTNFSNTAMSKPAWRKKPTTYFMNSMGDTYHENNTFETITRAFYMMRDCPQHTFQVLTKRAKRMEKWYDYLTYESIVFQSGCWPIWGPQNQWSGPPRSKQWPLPNVWMGVSVENRDYINRIDYLRRTPAAIRFLSIEPLLGPIPDLNLTDIDWVIVGGESGPGARPMRKEWVIEIETNAWSKKSHFFSSNGAGSTKRKWAGCWTDGLGMRCRRWRNEMFKKLRPTASESLRDKDPQLFLVLNRFLDLTDRQLWILDLFYEGYSGGEIAHRIGITQISVNRHVSNSMDTIGLYGEKRKRSVLVDLYQTAKRTLDAWTYDTHIQGRIS